MTSTSRKILKPLRAAAVVRAGTILCAGVALAAAAGCGHDPLSAGSLEAVWGRRGISDGRLQKPRAMAVDGDRIYIIDMSARIQVFGPEGQLLRPPQQTPKFENGKPTGLSIDRQGNLMVADTHYYRVLFYAPSGKLLEERTLGGTAGRGPGEFGLVTDAVEDSQGNIYVAEYGDFDRVQKFSPDGKFLLQWGGHGSKQGQFRRPQNLAVDKHDQIWVADACNHRVQVFDNQGKFVRMWGIPGSASGQMTYPYDLVVTDRFVYVCEFGNNRVQKFTHEGKSLGCFGTAGRGRGEFHNPWALALDNKGRVLVLDTNNHRVQRIRM